MDDDLRQALTAVKARSAHARRARRAWAGAGCAALLGAGAVGVAQARSGDGTTADQETASMPTTEDERGTAEARRTTTTVGERPERPTSTTTDRPQPSTTVPTTATTAPSPPRPTTPTGPTPTTTRPPQQPPPPGPTSTTATTTPTPPTTRPAPPGTPTPLADAIALWSRKGPSSYQMTLQRLCFCASIEPMQVTVIDGVVRSGGEGAVSIDEIYRQASAIGPEGSITELRVDRTTGAPTIVGIDFVAMMADDEVTYVITEFVAIASDDG